MDFYQGMPVITKNNFGEGLSYYVATVSSDEFYTNFLVDVCKEATVEPVIPPINNVEVTKRIGTDKDYIFLLNHRDEPVEISYVPEGVDLLTGKKYFDADTINLEQKEVAIIEICKREITT